MNLFFKEILDAHELIKEWLGNEDARHEVCENLLARFSPDYSMVTTGGGLLNFTTLNAFFRTQRGARPGLEIVISGMQMITENGSGATVVYKELQQLPNQRPTRRFSTAVFELNHNGKVFWRHLQETSLPPS